MTAAGDLFCFCFSPFWIPVEGRFSILFYCFIQPPLESFSSIPWKIKWTKGVFHDTRTLLIPILLPFHLKFKSQPVTVWLAVSSWKFITSGWCTGSFVAVCFRFPLRMRKISSNLWKKKNWMLWLCQIIIKRLY